MYYQAVHTGLGALRQLLHGLADLYEDSLFLSAYYEFLELEPRLREPSSPKRVPRPLRRGLVFEEVSFSYPGSARTALEGVSLEVAPGEMVALVGANGSGKSTVVKLLARLYDPAAGSIRLEGLDLRDLSREDLHRNISVLFQDYQHYDLTARQNVWLGDVARDPGDPGVEEAARRAGAHDLLQRLPRGYDTLLGNWFDDGEQLSAGEWQKVALARAFLREAPLLVLDEPASSLDPEAEWRLFQQLRQAGEDRAVLLISHRFSTVQPADRIYLLEHGRVAEAGSHLELLARGGLYASLYEKQTGLLRDAPV
jgi:ATP-binding cassette subfamily B protein